MRTAQECVGQMISEYTPPRGRQSRNFSEAGESTVQRPGGACHRLLPLNLKQEQALEFPTLGNPFDALSPNSITPQLQRSNRRTHDSPAETINRRRAVTHPLCRIGIRLRGTGARSPCSYVTNTRAGRAAPPSTGKFPS